MKNKRHYYDNSSDDENDGHTRHHRSKHRHSTHRKDNIKSKHHKKDKDQKKHQNEKSHKKHHRHHNQIDPEFISSDDSESSAFSTFDLDLKLPQRPKIPKKPQRPQVPTYHEGITDLKKDQ